MFEKVEAIINEQSLKKCLALETNLSPIITVIDPDDSNENSTELAEDTNKPNVLTDYLIDITTNKIFIKFYLKKLMPHLKATLTYMNIWIFMIISH